jgi:acetyl-CoA carboxylase biotin carboxylase subunit
MNTRIQVEHPVTEMITGVDLVAQQLKIAGGEPLALKQSDIHAQGHAIECRINAESPQHGFRPCPGRIEEWLAPEGAGVRLDSHCYAGYFVSPYYDSLLGKLIVHGADRAQAADRTKHALAAFKVTGIDTGIPFLQTIIDDPEYQSGKVNTRWLEKQLEEYTARYGSQ